MRKYCIFFYGYLLYITQLGVTWMDRAEDSNHLEAYSLIYLVSGLKWLEDWTVNWTLHVVCTSSQWWIQSSHTSYMAIHIFKRKHFTKQEESCMAIMTWPQMSHSITLQYSAGWSSKKPTQIQGERDVDPNFQWKECKRFCSRVLKLANYF